MTRRSVAARCPSQMQLPVGKFTPRRLVLAVVGVPKSVISWVIPMRPPRSDHTAVELLRPPEGVPVGERITVEGFPGEPDEQVRGLQGAGRRAQGAGCRVDGVGCRVQGAGWRVQRGAGRRAQGAGCRVYGGWCRV